MNYFLILVVPFTILFVILVDGTINILKFMTTNIKGEAIAISFVFL